MADTHALMPCPFCGGEAILSPARFDLEGYTVNCPRHHAGHTCFVEISLWRKTKSEAIAAWNTRATPPAAVVEAMEKALRAISERHIPDQPASCGGDELGWVVRQYADQRATARSALAALTAWRDAQ